MGALRFGAAGLRPRPPGSRHVAGKRRAPDPSSEYEAPQSDIDEQRFWDLADSATAWIGNRTLDTGYLSPSSQIRLWSDPEHVYIGWDNSLKVFRGSPAWSAGRGLFSLPLVEFISEVVSFHDRLMEQMDERVKRVVAGALPNSVHVDIPGLEREHAYRCINDMNRRTVPTTTDWDRVRAAIAEIECAPSAQPLGTNSDA